MPMAIMLIMMLMMTIFFFSDDPHQAALNKRSSGRNRTPGSFPHFGDASPA